MTDSATVQHSSVEAEVNYTAPLRERPRIYAFDPPPGIAKSNIVAEPHRVAVHDARPNARAFTLDGQGLALINHESAAIDFDDEKEIRQTYYAEAEQLLKDVTGADRVFIFDHTIRCYKPGVSDYTDGPRQPATRVHVDHTANSAPQRVRAFLPYEAEELLKHRVQIINLWRPIKHPVYDAPLAICDATTVSPDDIVPSDLVYPKRVGETYNVRFGPNHCWYYVPQMQLDEVLLLKCTDSRTDVAARFTPHTAFLEENVPEAAPRRESIELPTLVFHQH
jgi:hypothetical protein